MIKNYNLVIVGAGPTDIFIATQLLKKDSNLNILMLKRERIFLSVFVR